MFLKVARVRRDAMVTREYEEGVFQPVREFCFDAIEEAAERSVECDDNAFNAGGSGALRVTEVIEAGETYPEYVGMFVLPEFVMIDSCKGSVGRDRVSVRAGQTLWRTHFKAPLEAWRLTLLFEPPDKFFPFSSCNGPVLFVDPGR